MDDSSMRGQKQSRIMATHPAKGKATSPPIGRGCVENGSSVARQIRERACAPRRSGRDHPRV
jgi:hypothetical protein